MTLSPHFTLWVTLLIACRGTESPLSPQLKTALEGSHLGSVKVACQLNCPLFSACLLVFLVLGIPEFRGTLLRTHLQVLL